MDNMRDEVSVQRPGESATQACRAVAFLSSVASAKEEAKAGPTAVKLLRESRVCSTHRVRAPTVCVNKGK
jgi:hypothetical protein